MKKIAWITLIYALLILVGGIVGHLKASSYASLIAGTVSGTILLLCTWASFRGKVLGGYVALLVTFLLGGFFAYRFLLTHKWMPAGLLSLLSLIVLLSVALSLQKGSKKKTS